MSTPTLDLPLGPEAPWLAPLAGYSDLPFRMLCRSFGAACCVTEMVSVKGLTLSKNTGTQRLLDTIPGDGPGGDNPLVVQLFGAEPERFRRAVGLLMERGFTHFDLNAGCPVKKVLKSGGGAGLLDDPDRLTAIARAMAEAAGPGRVGVKTRLGFATGDKVYLDLGKRLEDAGVAWMTLHPRYGKQMFTGRADWEHLAALKAGLTIPIMASGDLYTAENGLACLRETGADAVMYARGAMADPTIFARHLALARGGTPPERTGQTMADLITEHIRLTRELQGDARSFRKVRSIIPRYAKGLRDIRAFRAELSTCRDWDALTEAARTIADMAPAT